MRRAAGGSDFRRTPEGLGRASAMRTRLRSGGVRGMLLAASIGCAACRPPPTPIIPPDATTDLRGTPPRSLPTLVDAGWRLEVEAPEMVPLSDGLVAIRGPSEVVVADARTGELRWRRGVSDLLGREHDHTMVASPGRLAVVDDSDAWLLDARDGSVLSSVHWPDEMDGCTAGLEVIEVYDREHGWSLVAGAANRSAEPVRRNGAHLALVVDGIVLAQRRGGSPRPSPPRRSR